MFSTCAAHFHELNFDSLPEAKQGTQPCLKTNWPFSMENMSCRWVGGGVPAYFPPLFLRTKQAMSATRVRSATAHMVPMNQPWVEKSLRWPTAAENKNSKETKSSSMNFTHRRIWVWQSPQALLIQLHIWLKTEKHDGFSFERMFSRRIWLTFPLAITISLQTEY